MICKKCNGYIRKLNAESRESGVCGYCRGTTPIKPRQAKKMGRQLVSKIKPSKKFIQLEKQLNDEDNKK